MMNTNNEHYTDDSYRLTHQQQRFCDEYLSHFNAFKAAINSGYSENTSRKGALLHVPKIQRYLKEAMNRRSQRLEITHDMILRELSKIAFSNMGNYYDEYACLKRMSELTVDEKAAISYYDFVEIQDGDGYRVGTQSRIKLHNKMSALDKIARHLDFYGTLGVKKVAAAVAVAGEEDGSMSESLGVRKMEVAAAVAGESPKSESPEDGKMELATTVAVVDRSANNLPMDYPVEDFELEGIELKTVMALEDVNISPGAPWFEVEDSPMSESSEVRKMEKVAAAVAGGFEDSPMSESPEVRKREVAVAGELVEEEENMKNILTISPLREEDSRGKNQEARFLTMSM